MQRSTRTLVYAAACSLAMARALPASAEPRPSPTGAAPEAQPARAEPKTRNQLEAQQHFQRAKDLYQTGSYREAIAELEAARALDPSAKDLMFNLGVLHEKLGKFDAAIDYFRQYLEMDGVTLGERAKAETMITRIEGAKRALPTTPGSTVAAAAPHDGATPSTETGTLGPTVPPPAPVQEPQRGRIDALTVNAGALAIVGLGVGTTFGLLALNGQPSKTFVTGRDGTYNELKEQASRAHTEALVADIGLGVGIVATALTAYLYFGRTKDASKAPITPSAAPVGSRGGVLLVGGRFQ
jgi:tetratricopeptide (TPR) repeat protein